jgi:membrane protein
MKTVSRYLKLLKAAGTGFINDNAIKLSASLAFYTIFSIGPLLLVIITLIGVFFKDDNFTREFRNQFQALIGAQGANLLFTIIDNIRHQNHTKLFGIIGIIVLIFGATGVFTEIQGSINFIWSIRVKPKKGWLKYLTDRFISFSILVGISFLLIVSLTINTTLDLVNKRLRFLFGDINSLLFQVTSAVLLFVTIVFLFTVIYKVLLDARISWKDAVVGSCYTGIFFMIGKFLIGFYLGNSIISVTYGAAASFIILLSWVYYSSIILYFGAEFTKEYTISIGNGIEPYSNAVFIIKREVKELPNSSGRD